MWTVLTLRLWWLTMAHWTVPPTRFRLPQLIVRLLSRMPAATEWRRERATPAPLAIGADAVHARFVRLPNPDLVMYVTPHLVGADGVPIPGYVTTFPLYTRVHYALPGERR